MKKFHLSISIQPVNVHQLLCHENANNEEAAIHNNQHGRIQNVVREAQTCLRQHLKLRSSQNYFKHISAVPLIGMMINRGLNSTKVTNSTYAFLIVKWFAL